MEGNRGLWLITILVLATIIIGLQVWASIESTRQVEAVMVEMQQLSSKVIDTEKSREELVKTRIENRRASLFWHTLIGVMAPMLTALVAAVGIVTGWRDHLDSRNKERLDRAATDLAKAFERLASENSLERALGVASLQHFLEADKESYHLRALSALITVARAETDDDVLRAVRIAINQAVRTLKPEYFRAITWQGVKLRGVLLNKFDLRAADISGAELQDAKLIHANLTQSNLEQTKLNGADMGFAVLKHANLTGADLSGASLRNAVLDGAEFKEVWVHGLDIDEANFTNVQLDVDRIPWDQIRNWRTAKFDQNIAEQLVRRYGPLTKGPKVLMLLWEIPPYVEGGSWTACYHLIRRLRQAGADITVVVPWENSGENLSPFGVEITLIYLGIHPPYRADPQSCNVYGNQNFYSPYQGFGSYAYNYSRGPYSSGYGVFGGGHTGSPDRGFGIYGDRPVSVYGGSISGGMRYVPRSFFGTYSPYDVVDARGIYPIFGVVQEFARRMVKRLGQQHFDLIHAQDWVTFRAAKELSRKTHIPWLAHFHSTEADRQPNAPHPGIQALERNAAQKADRIIAVSQVTARRVETAYQTPHDKIVVVHNPLSPETIDPLNWGTPETRRIVYLGRFAEQKGTDRFANLATLVKQRTPSAGFVMIGDGFRSPVLQKSFIHGVVQIEGAIPWEQRYEAFRGASLVVVPSRFEPFGMVILEAMMHRVPVIYPEASGAAEVIQAGFPIDPENIRSMADIVHQLLFDWNQWKQVVDEQTVALETYVKSTPETRLMQEWENLWTDAG